MALVQRTYTKMSSFITRINIRSYSKSTVEKDVKKSVYISQSKDIHTNLALEDWIYRNVDFKNNHILMLWQNDPCVVIGRHQNPWLEANFAELPSITEQGVKLARRNSGGGTVFHDLGNLNLTFFTPREHYNRKYNLEIITRSLFREFGMAVDISSREDLLVRDYKEMAANHAIKFYIIAKLFKNDEQQLRRGENSYTSNHVKKMNFYGDVNPAVIRGEVHASMKKKTYAVEVSGTASKLGRPSAYHHCTLLVNVNKVDLSLALHRQEADIKTNATQSIKSKVMNLCEENPDISVTKLIKAVGWEYMRTPAYTLMDGGMELANQQKGFQFVNPTNAWFPGLDELREQYTSWDWCFGKTPKFDISRSFNVPDSLVNSFGASGDVKVTMTVENGRISNVTLFVPPGLSSDGFAGEANVVTSLIGQKFTEDALNNLEGLMSGLVDDRDRFVTECLKQVMSSV